MSTNLVTVYVPAEYSLGGEVGGLRPTSMARLEMARADWLLRSVNDFVPRIDRSSNRDHQKLVTMLIGHEMRLRSASRSEQRTLAAGDAEATRSGEGARAGFKPLGPAGWRLYAGPIWSRIWRSRTDTWERSRRARRSLRRRFRSRMRRSGFGRSGGRISLLGVLPGVDDPPAKMSLVVGGPVLERRTRMSRRVERSSRSWC